MSDHVETVKAIYAAFGRGDVPGILAHIAPDVEWEHDWGGTPLPIYAARRGHAGVLAFFAALQDWEFLRFEPVSFCAGGDRVAVAIRLELRHRATGGMVRDLESHWWTFGPDGKVTRMRHMADTLQFARAAALVPEPA